MPLLGAVQDPTPTATAGAPAPRPAPASHGPVKPRVRLGEELPIFCERCGYSLHGLPQTRCERCAVLQYACPECNHHQPINTLRPAAERILGRIRAFALGFWVLVKLNFFGWLLFAWGGMGVEWTYTYAHVAGGRGPSSLVPRPLDIEAFFAFGLFAFVFGLFSRMLLLRWRRGALVGAMLAALVVVATMIGAHLRWLDASSSWSRGTPAPLRTDLVHLAGWAAGLVVFGAVIVWPIWMSLVYLFLPKRTAEALLEWQRSLSAPKVEREPALAT